MKSVYIKILFALVFNILFDDICLAQNRDVFHLNCDSLIDKYKNSSIRSILPDNKNSFYERPLIEGHFVRYIIIADSMIQDEPAGDIIGTLVVYETTNCEKEKKFIEFISNVLPSISVDNNNLKVGSFVDELIKVLGPPEKIIDNYYLYNNLNGTLTGIFYVNNEKIESFRIGEYNKKTLNSIETQLTLLLKHYP